MKIVVSAVTRGDELISPIVKPVLVASNPEEANEFIAQQTAEREAWLRDNPVPWFMQASIIDHYEVQEVAAQ